MGGSGRALSTLTQQLDCGARALDIWTTTRPVGGRSPQVFIADTRGFWSHQWHPLNITLMSAVQSVLGWVASHPDEMVVLYLSRCEDQLSPDGATGCAAAISVLAKLGVQTIEAGGDLANLTYSAAFARNRLKPGGAVLALAPAAVDADSSTSPIMCYPPDTRELHSPYCWPGGSVMSNGGVPYLTACEHVDEVAGALWAHTNARSARAGQTTGGLMWTMQCHWDYDNATITKVHAHTRTAACRFLLPPSVAVLVAQIVFGIDCRCEIGSTACWRMNKHRGSMLPSPPRSTPSGAPSSSTRTRSGSSV